MLYVWLVIWLFDVEPIMSWARSLRWYEVVALSLAMALGQMHGHKVVER